MFQFEIPDILWYLIFLPIAGVLSWLWVRWRQKKLSERVDLVVFRRLYQGWIPAFDTIRNIMFLLAVGMMIIAWSNPQWGSRKQKVKVKSSDIVIALDISQSMMAEDVSPNRIERAKRFVTELLDELKGDRVGLVFFAGSAYLQMPLSHDLASAELYVKSANPKQAGTQGTVIADALKLSSSIFSGDDPSQKAIILITDGENHESQAINIAESLNENGTTVFALGIGTVEGAYIPFLERGRRVYKRDKDGQPVSSSFNITLLQDIADAGGGDFYLIDETFSAIDKLTNELGKLEKQETEQRSFTDYNSYFQYFLSLTLLLLIIEMMLGNRYRTKLLKTKS